MKKSLLKIMTLSLAATSLLGVSLVSVSKMNNQFVQVDAASSALAFGTNGTRIDGANVTATDELGTSWAIATVGTTSFTQQATYSQVGSSSKPATSITFTGTVGQAMTLTSFSIKFGGFSGTAGSVTVKVGSNASYATGSLNATTDVTVSGNASATLAANDKIVVSVTSIAKGVKVYGINYTYSSDTPTEKKLSSIAVSGQTTEYNINDSFSFDGVCTASYSDDTTATVTPTSISSPDMATEGKKVVTVSYTEDDVTKTATYNIYVVDPTITKVTFDLTEATAVTATDSKLAWAKTPVSMEFNKGDSTTNTNNYYPGSGSYSSTRAYKNSEIVISVAEGYYVTSIVFNATTTGYATACAGNTWINGTAAANDTVTTVTASAKATEVAATVNATQGFTSVEVFYEAKEVTPPGPTGDEFAIVAPEEIDFLSENNAFTYENLPENNNGVFAWLTVDSDKSSTNFPENSAIEGETSTTPTIWTVDDTATSFYIQAYYLNATYQPVYATPVKVDVNYGLYNFVTDFADLRVYCNNGVNPNVSEITETWEILELYWEDLSSTEQATFKATVANANEEIFTLENTAALYDLLVAKYNLSNFASRTVSSMSRGLMSITKDTATATAIVAVAAISSISLVGALAVSKKRKEN